MAKRKISLEPEQDFLFKTDESYRKPWSFLPDKDGTRIIGQQLTFLAFHKWLKDNLRHSPEKYDLSFSVAEGFFKTDVLLYASICEAALHAVLRKLFDDKKSEACERLSDCFEKDEPKQHKILDGRVEIEMTGKKRSGHLVLVSNNRKKRSQSELQFSQLIQAGEACGVYDEHFRLRLDQLRDDRNAIHLAKHLKRRDSRKEFNSSDREFAELVTSELRELLRQFVEKEAL